MQHYMTHGNQWITDSQHPRSYTARATCNRLNYIDNVNITDIHLLCEHANVKVLLLDTQQLSKELTMRYPYHYPINPKST